MNLCLIRFALITVLVQIAFGQQTPAPPSQSPGQPQQAQQEEESERMLGVLPQFGVTNQKNPPPLSSRQKFRLFYKTALDPVEFGVVGIQAGVSQAVDQFQEYGQGASGYAKRYGAAFTDQASSGFFGNFLYPVVLKQDPRYFRKGEGPT